MGPGRAQRLGQPRASAWPPPHSESGPAAVLSRRPGRRASGARTRRPAAVANSSTSAVSRTTPSGTPRAIRTPPNSISRPAERQAEQLEGDRRRAGPTPLLPQPAGHQEQGNSRQSRQNRSQQRQARLGLRAAGEQGHGEHDGQHEHDQRPRPGAARPARSEPDGPARGATGVARRYPVALGRVRGACATPGRRTLPGATSREAVTVLAPALPRNRLVHPLIWEQAGRVKEHNAVTARCGTWINREETARSLECA